MEAFLFGLPRAIGLNYNIYFLYISNLRFFPNVPRPIQIPYADEFKYKVDGSVSGILLREVDAYEIPTGPELY